MRRILLLGKQGRLGSQLTPCLKALGHVVALDRLTCDITYPAMLEYIVDSVRPDVIVNATGYTAVDRAEADPINTYLVNADSVRTLAQLATHYRALLVHYSTDYVFDGQQSVPYVESDAPNPLSIYGHSKLLGEEWIVQHTERYLILRTSWLFDALGEHFPKRVVRAAYQGHAMHIVEDEWGVPTPIIDVVAATCSLLSQYFTQHGFARYGLYHLASSGLISRFDYAKEVLAEAKRCGMVWDATVHLHPISAKRFSRPAKRPRSVALNAERLRQSFGIALPDWTHRLALFVPKWLSDVARLS